MASTLAAIIVLGLITMFWLESARARELAVGISRAACDKERYQLLDDSVYLQRFALRWTAEGLRFRRMFRFDYSIDGSLRESGYVLLLGKQLEAVHIKGRHTIEQEKIVAEMPETTPSAEIIPFPKKH